MAKNEVGTLFQARAKADQVYRLTCEIENLHAVQGQNDAFTPLSHQALAETADTVHGEGIPSGESASPVGRRRSRRTVKEKAVQTYRFQRNGKPGIILLALGGPYGFFAKTLRDAAAAKGKARYLDYMQSLVLIRFEVPDGDTEYAEVKAQTTISALDVKSEAPFPRMEPRNTRGQRTMVPVFHERLAKPIRVSINMIINAECPRTEEEIAGLLHAMQGMACGPAKRGRIKIVTVERIQ